MSVVKFTCDNCGGPGYDRSSEYAKKKRHFCKRQCYSEYRRDKLPQEEQHAWQGGVSPEESRRRWAAKNKKTLLARKAARRQREIDAPGSHTRSEWEAIKKASNYTCVEHEDGTCRGGITKDHKVPLIMGGSQNASNLQVMCRSHNSRKSTQVYLEVIKQEEKKAND